MSGRSGRVDQGMARAAAEILGDGPISGPLRTRYRQLPVMLHTTGLAATYAFVLSKTGGRNKALAEAYDRVANGIRKHIATRRLIPGCTEKTPPRDVLQAMGNCGGVTYARATAEITLLAGWLSRLAEARHQADAMAKATDAESGSSGKAEGKP
ncbi:hypothetical protein GCM10027160_00570 [Streptomyces calidiresistens]|uniref:CRISPR type III-B/RAMP module-associated protein Cmr5 n=1 Tax=Streptomyces calidiresistens TaxID=1485586 RepID=A0A7W3SZX7_9ACTN|nr:type III-B CRISPR module-associated protein Cmr5 [Streptomyces calidiresistens]MBB0228325.1 hypothetical protein [Streptomyces calidiresistens]